MQVAGDVTIIEGIDVATDDVAAKLAASPLAGVAIDVVVHNAGGINGTRKLEVRRRCKLTQLTQAFESTRFQSLIVKMITVLSN